MIPQVEHVQINRGSVNGMRLIRTSIDSALLAIYESDWIKVLVTLDHTHHGPLLHLSISHRSRYPTWDEIVGVREALLPHGTDFMMMLPKIEDYINLHENCFHLWQTPKAWDIQ